MTIESPLLGRLQGYIGGRWQFGALEMTSSEIARALQEARVSDEVRERFDVFFGECDLVKFAKYRPEPDDARGAAAEAEALVRRTSGLDLVPPPAAGPAAAEQPPPPVEPTAGPQPPPPPGGER